jgi:mediator of RNA polymerase II transcription subunit 8, fungi type
MSTHSALFEKATVFPSTNFPGRTQENLLGQLLRKKLEPSVEAWVEEGRAVQIGNEGSGEEEKDIEEVWREARGFIGERVARAAVTHRTDAYTAEEREMGMENVNTGLMQPIKLGNADEESDEDEENDGDEEMVDAGRNGEEKGEGAMEEKKYDGLVRTLDDIVRFMTIGKTPEDGSEPLTFETRR